MTNIIINNTFWSAFRSFTSQKSWLQSNFLPVLHCRRRKDI